MSTSNRIRNIAIVGAGGNSGKFMTEALLASGKHTITAITRIDSQSKLPDGVIVKKVNYEEPSTIVDALRGQDVLIITVSVFAGRDTEGILIDAAAKAEVPWVLPNAWSSDTDNPELVRDVVAFQGQTKAREAIAKLPKTSFISVQTSFWYEWSLAIPNAYGFDFKTKTVTLFDDGNTKISMSTWPQVGRAVAALLNLPIEAENGDSERCLENFRNKLVFVDSFLASQNDMLESVLRVTGDQKSDWTIKEEPSIQRYKQGIEAMQKGDRIGFIRMMYTRVFFQDGVGNFEKNRGTSNKLLILPEENIDEATERAIERSKTVTFG